MSGQEIEEARKAAKSGKLDVAEQLYFRILEKPNSHNESLIQEKEDAIKELGTLYRDNDKIDQLAALIPKARTVIGSFAKSKTAKIIRNLVDLLATVPNSIDVQIATLKDCIQWTIEEKRSFLRQSLQYRLASLYFERGTQLDAITLIDSLLRELKRLDDKSTLVDVQLLEAKVYHAFRNIPKARAALTSARTSANSIYCPPLQQAELDNMSGILHAEDKDYKTAFSYFYEAFEGYAGQENPKTVTVLKYMLLSKIMLNLTDDVNQILSSKTASKYVRRDIDAMKAIAKAYSNRSLKEFEDALSLYGKELSADPIIRSHFTALYDTLLEQNLVKVIEPFSCVEISHVAEVIGLDSRQVEGKLSQMILDKVFYGVLDQGNGWLFIYDDPKTDETYDASLETIKHMSNVVDLLYEKAASLN